MIRLFVKFCVRVFTLFLFRVKTYGQENIEKGKPYIMCANHRSNWDPPILYTATKREMYMMAKEELFKNKFLYWFAGKTNIFPVKRGKIQNGPAYLAARTGVEIIPVYIEGSFKPFRKVRVYYGKPLDFSKYKSKKPEKETLDIISNKLIDTIWGNEIKQLK